MNLSSLSWESAHPSSDEEGVKRSLTEGEKL